MRKWGLGLLVLLLVLAGAFFAFGPGLIEASNNKIDNKPLLNVTAEARALHKTLIIADLHSDSLLWSRDINQRADRGHVDVPRLQDGNVALQIFSSVTKTPKNQNYESNSGDSDNITSLVFAQMQPMRTLTSLLERSLWHAEKLKRAVLGSNGQIIAVKNSAELGNLLKQRLAAKSAPPIGAMLSIEGLHDLEGKADNLDRLYAAGFRMASLTHFFDNQLAGSMHGLKKGGLTDFGRNIFRQMEDKGMIVDIAHCSHACVADELAMATRPVVSSHGGVQATCKVNRNLTDDEIRGVAKTGGVIGIGYWDAAICDTSPTAVAKAIKHVRDLVGIQYVALGSDYDGATTVRFDTSQLLQVTQALLNAGFSEAEIRGVMGENAVRVINAGIQPKTMPSPT